MFARLRPLDAILIFEDREYMLGDTIDISVELNTKGAVQVRQARIDLVCEERWTESFSTGSGSAGSVATQAMGSHNTGHTPERVNKEQKNSFVHSSAVFIEQELLESGDDVSRELQLTIQSEQPPHATRAIVTWSLDTHIDVVGATDVRVSQPIEVRAVESENQDSELTPEERRENARKAAQARWNRARQGS